jgi:transcription initiation factor TFIIH subunit 3
VASLLVFINAHLACNYTNKVAVIASHSTTAQWLYPSPVQQRAPQLEHERRRLGHVSSLSHDHLSESTKRLRINGPKAAASSDSALRQAPESSSESNKYRPFRLVEEELVRNLTTLLASTDPAAVSTDSSTMIAGALTLALSYINRETIAYTESLSGPAAANAADQPNAADLTAPSTQILDSRILLLSVSPSPDLAHQYIPIMNAIFACQRLSIPIDVLQIPLPVLPAHASSTTSSTAANTTPAASPFLQQASDATHGIYISIPPPTSQSTPPSLITYLLTALLPSPSTRHHLVLPTSISVDFRAACFCHRNIISIGFVCSVCLSIFCAVPENGDCLTCGTHLAVGDSGGRPVVVSRKKKRRRGEAGAAGGESGFGTPTPG